MKFQDFLLSLLLGLPILCSSQMLTLSGKVWDKTTREPLAYANVFLKQSKKGVITNREGNFTIKLNPGELPDSLIVSYLGYAPFKIHVLKAGALDIPLEKSSYALDEVLIMPDSTLWVLLRKAYERIERNYPQSPNMLTGFYRENMMTEDDAYIYLSESVFDFYKTEYSPQYKNDEGQVKIKKVRNFLSPNVDSANDVSFYNGPFMVNYADYVKRRARFLHPKYYADFTYKLAGYSSYLGQKTYEITFSLKSKSSEKQTHKVGGTLFISVDSLVYVGIDFFRKSLEEIVFEEGTSFFGVSGYETLSRNVRVRYQPDGETWYLKSILYAGEGINKKLQTKLHFEDLYVCTQVATQNVKPIPFNERFGYREVIAGITDTLDGSFFEEYTILSRDTLFDKRSVELFNSKRTDTTFNRSDNQLVIAKQQQQAQQTQLQKLLKLYNFIRRFSISYRVGVLPVTTNFQGLNLSFQSGNIAFTTQMNPPNTRNLLFVTSQATYKFSPQFGILYANTLDLDPEFRFDTYEVGMFYDVLIKRKGKPLFLTPDIRMVFARVGVQSEDVENPSEFEFGEKTFNSETIKFTVGTARHILMPGIRMQYKLNRRLWLHAHASYLWELNEDRRAWLGESSGFISFRKNTKVKLPNEAFELTYLGSSSESNRISLGSFQFSLGIGF